VAFPLDVSAAFLSLDLFFISILFSFSRIFFFAFGFLLFLFRASHPTDVAAEPLWFSVPLRLPRVRFPRLNDRVSVVFSKSLFHFVLTQPNWTTSPRDDLLDGDRCVPNSSAFF
jgi:hypothetical protein